MPQLPVGQRATDPPDKGISYRIGLAIHKYPIHAAVLVVLVVLSVPVWLLIDAAASTRSGNESLEAAVGRLQSAQGELHAAQETNRVLTERVAEQNAEIQAQRAEALTLLCTLEGAILGVLRRNPRAAGGSEAIKRLKSVDCDALLRDAIHDAE